MCDFFSFVSNGKGKYFYFDWSQRTDKLIKVDSFDSHSEICAHYGIDCDKVNKYEYNPLTSKFKTDQINLKKDDSGYAKIWVEKLDFKTIVKPLVIKQIINPFIDKRKLKATARDNELAEMKHDYDRDEDDYESAWIDDCETCKTKDGLEFFSGDFGIGKKSKEEAENV